MRKVIKIPFDLDVPGELEIYTHLAGLRNRGRIDMLCAALGMHPDPVAHTSISTPTPTPALVVVPAPVPEPAPAPVVAHETKSINDNDTSITTPNPNIDLGLSQMY